MGIALNMQKLGLYHTITVALSITLLIPEIIHAAKDGFFRKVINK